MRAFSVSLIVHRLRQSCVCALTAPTVPLLSQHVLLQVGNKLYESISSYIIYYAIHSRYGVLFGGFRGLA